MDLKETLIRQRDLIPVEVLSKRITMIGGGAVGSWTALALAKMGFLNLEVWDDDVIDVANMNCQFFPYELIGSKKVIALVEMVKLFTSFPISARDERYEGQPLIGDIVISAVDSMQVRKLIFEKCTARYLIDPRMAAEKMLLYVVDMKDKAAREAYAKSLYTDEDAVHERCTAKSTIYCANILAGFVAKAVKNLACGQKFVHNMIMDLTVNAAEMWSTEVE